MYLKKKNFIISLIVLLFGLSFILGLSIIINLYLSTIIENKVTKEEATLNTRIAFEEIKKEYLNSSQKILYLGRKLSFLNNEKAKLLNYKQTIRSKEYVVLYFRENTPFYKIIQRDGSTSFFYMSNFNFKLLSNNSETSYTPNLLLNIKRSIYSYGQLSDKENKELQEKSKKIINIIQTDLDNTISKINGTLKNDKNLDNKYIQNLYLTFLKASNENIETRINEFTPDEIINILGISKVLILGILSFFAIILIIMIKQLIDTYNKSQILNSMQNNKNSLNLDQINRHKEMVLTVNEFYKNKKEESKDIILETLKASKSK